MVISHLINKIYINKMEKLSNSEKSESGEGIRDSKSNESSSKSESTSSIERISSISDASSAKNSNGIRKLPLHNEANFYYYANSEEFKFIDLSEVDVPDACSEPGENSEPGYYGYYADHPPSDSVRLSDQDSKPATDELPRIEKLSIVMKAQPNSLDLYRPKLADYRENAKRIEEIEIIEENEEIEEIEENEEVEEFEENQCNDEQKFDDNNEKLKYKNGKEIIDDENDLEEKIPNERYAKRIEEIEIIEENEEIEEIEENEEVEEFEENQCNDEQKFDDNNEKLKYKNGKEIIDDENDLEEKIPNERLNKRNDIINRQIIRRAMVSDDSDDNIFLSLNDFSDHGSREATGYYEQHNYINPSNFVSMVSSELNDEEDENMDVYQQLPLQDTEVYKSIPYNSKPVSNIKEKSNNFQKYILSRIDSEKVEIKSRFLVSSLPYSLISSKELKTIFVDFVNCEFIVESGIHQSLSESKITKAPTQSRSREEERKSFQSSEQYSYKSFSKFYESEDNYNNKNNKERSEPDPRDSSSSSNSSSKSKDKSSVHSQNSDFDEDYLEVNDGDLMYVKAYRKAFLDQENNKNNNDEESEIERKFKRFVKYSKDHGIIKLNSNKKILWINCSKTEETYLKKYLNNDNIEVVLGDRGLFEHLSVESCLKAAMIHKLSNVILKSCDRKMSNNKMQYVKANNLLLFCDLSQMINGENLELSHFELYDSPKLI